MHEKEIITVDEFLASVTVAEPQSHRNLTILPLMSGKTNDLRLKTLEEALSEGTIEITEDGGGSVNSLRVANHGDTPVLLLSGTILKANLQDRVLRTTFISYPHSVVTGECFCVESDRWRPIRSQEKAVKPDRHLSADIRMNFSKSNQNDIWSQIEKKRKRMNVQGNTESADHIYEQYQVDIEEYKKAFTCRPDYAGCIALIEGKPIGMDISGIKEIFHRQFSDLVSSFVIDALDSAYCEEVRKQKPLTVDQFLRAVARAKKQTQEALGGTGIKFESGEVVGGALVDHDHNVVVQIEAFATY